MASRRDLKKDIAFLADDLFTNSYFKQVLFENVDQQKLAEVIVKSVDFRNQFMARVNHTDGKNNPKLVKAYYKKMRIEMMQQYADLSQELSAL